MVEIRVVRIRAPKKELADFGNDFLAPIWMVVGARPDRIKISRLDETADGHPRTHLNIFCILILSHCLLDNAHIHHAPGSV
ncbi:MAG: hypothetical protein MUF31_05590 [Akkermansiaceae bacterium]|jgi:hypothetical protein|nr:hypothetical protein [Akkermansiaceae bacterium]